MPLYDVSYHRFEGERTSHQRRCWALARTHIQTLLKRRLFLLLLAASWIPAIVRAGQIYIVHQFPQSAEFIEVSPTLWQDFLSWQIRLLLLIFVVLYAGSGSIATDLRTGAIVLYLSRPISRMGYVLGKFLPVFLSSLTITLLPGLALLLFQYLLVGDLSLLREAPWLPFSITVYSSLVAAYFSLVVLAVSSLSRSARLAAAGFVMLALGTHALYGMASRLTFGEAPPSLSLIASAIDAANLFFGAPPRNDSAPLASLLAMGLLMVASLFVLDRRLRSKEVSA
jgi:ABC-2 type transport system permease protein